MTLILVSGLQNKKKESSLTIFPALPHCHFGDCSAAKRLSLALEDNSQVFGIGNRKRAGKPVSKEFQL